ncbi:MAG: putative transcriptional regulator, partial [Actinomycetia bacterium]|nr:putative transcriptional regulator [Actinomycetes bacterium]
REILRQQLVNRHEQNPMLDDLSWSERLAARQAITVSITDYVRLLMWEGLETGSRKKPVMAEEERVALFAELRQRVLLAQECGDLASDLDPDQMVLSEVALTMFPVAFPQITRMVTGRTFDDPEFLAARQRFLLQLAAHMAGRPVET